MPTAITVRAFAKINLDLQVLDLRPDGYHELRTTFQSVAITDTLVFEKSRGPFRIECTDPALPTDRTNLIWRAAEQILRLARRRETPSAVTVRVDKNIPVQAGLGGGSSNAAAALRAFAALWRVRATDGELHHAAATLGADVPYFLHGGTAVGFHRGDLVFPLDDIAPAWVVIVVPDFGVSTKEAFGWWDAAAKRRRNRRDGQRAQDRRDGRDGMRTRRSSTNDLEAVVAERHPIVSTLVRALIKHGAFHASLSGSGSAVFGMFGRRSYAQAAARELAGPRTFVAPTLSRTACRRLGPPAR